MSLVADADVAIIGVGLAGAGAAITLARKGVRVVLIDPRETYQACFKAEKIEPDQAELLRKFGLLEGLLPFASRIHKVISARNGSVLRVLCLEQYGIFYQDIVNSVRRQIPASVDWKTARVHNVSPGSDISRLTFMDGTSMSARLIIIASGAGGNLSESLGIQRQMIRENQSFAIGFNISREDGRPFSVEALTYYPGGRCRENCIPNVVSHSGCHARQFICVYLEMSVVHLSDDLGCPVFRKAGQLLL